MISILAHIGGGGKRIFLAHRLEAQLLSSAMGDVSAMAGLGRSVRKGERSATVLFWKVFDVRGGSDTLNTDEEEQTKSERRCVARAYHVFNAARVERYAPAEFLHLSSSERIADAEENIPVLRVGGHFMQLAAVMISPK